MRSGGKNTGWSFGFLGKRQSRSCSSSSSSSSTFYCNDVGVERTDTAVVPNRSKKNELFNSMSTDCDAEDGEAFMTFCCGLGKLPARSTTFDSRPTLAPQPMPAKVQRKQDAEGGMEKASALLVPCKRGSLYPVDEACQSKAGAQEEFREQMSEGNVKTVIERRKIYEGSDQVSHAPVRPKPHPVGKVITGQNFRNSFTTEDADLFMRTPKLADRLVAKQTPGQPQKPDLDRLLNQNPLVVSNSMRDLSRKDRNLKTEAAPTDGSKPPQKPSVPAAKTEHKPTPPPKSTKIISFINAQRQKGQTEETKGPSAVPEGQSRAVGSSGDRPSGVGNSVSSSDSDSTFEDSDVDDSTCCFPSNGQLTSMESNTNFESKAQKVANELLESEKLYVGKLHLIDQVFHMEIIKRNRMERFIPDEVIPQIFANIKCIFQFHNDYLLPELTSCMKTWDEGPRVGAVMKKAAPFFKLYTDFVTNFSHASSLIAAWIAKSEKFVQLLDELQKHPECGNLTLQHHLLEPIQRVPRYQLLLTEYLKRLPEDSPDKEPVEAALKLVTEAAQHTNDEMKKMEKFKKLLDTCAMLVNHKGENLISINRELVREGKLKKISARDGSLLDRYLFLFNDILVVCMGLPLRIGFGQQYLVKSKLDICGMKVYEGNNEEHPNSFTIMSKQKSIEFTASSMDEKNEWVTEIWAVIKHFVEKERTKDKQFLQKMYKQTEELGKRAPTWVKDQDTSMCMLCSVTFKTFRRRHHCRACGKVVCNECSTHKLRMDFEKDKLNRVCDICYCALESSSSSPKIVHRHKGPAVLGMKATSEDMILCGYLQSSFDNKTWMKRWLVLHSNCALYIFKAKRDNTATHSLPLPGYRVEECPSPDGLSVRLNTFKIFHDKLPKVYFFSTDDRSLYCRWLESLRLAIVAELHSSPQIQSNSLVAPLGTPPILESNEMSLINEINAELTADGATIG